jgi:energy-converting hydrogenase B subunit D
MSVIQAIVLVLVAVAATGVVLTREPLAQAVTFSFFGLLLGILFFTFQAPDVALSQIAVGAVGLPLMVLLALAKTRGGRE